MVVTVLVIIVMFLRLFTIAVWSRNYWDGRFCAATDSLWWANTRHHLQNVSL